MLFRSPLGYRILGFIEEFTIKKVESGVHFLASLHSACKRLEAVKAKKIPEIFGRDLFLNLDLSGLEFASKWREVVPAGFPRFDKFI